MMPEIKYEKITDKHLTIIDKDGNKQDVEADTIIIATEPELNLKLYNEVKEKVSETFLVGIDDEEKGCIMNAVRNGYSIARMI